jgi:hypothetical protein
VTLVVGNASTWRASADAVFEVAADAGFSTSCFRVRAFRPARVVKRACASPMRWPPIHVFLARMPRRCQHGPVSATIAFNVYTRSCSRLRAYLYQQRNGRLTPPAVLLRERAAEMGLRLSSAIWLSWPILTRLPTRCR